MSRENWTRIPTAVGELEPVRDDSGKIKDFRWLYANPATADLLLNDARVDLTGKTILEVAPFLKGDPIIDFMAKSFEEKSRTRFVSTQKLQRLVGGMRFVARFETLGHTLISTLEDVSDLARAHDDAIDERRMFEAACDHSVHGLLFTDRRGKIQYANEAIASMLGYDRAALQRRSVNDLIHTDAYEDDVKLSRALLDGSIKQDIRDKVFIRADGSEMYVSVAMSVVDDFIDGKPLFIGHIRDVTRQREQDRRLKQALVQAEEAARLKSQFLANMSHEIRTPLNGVIGMAQVLEHSELTPEQAENLAVLKESGNTLMVLLNDILDLSKIEAGKLDITPVKADLRHKLSRVFRVHRVAASEKGLGFRTVIHPSVPSRLVFDPIRLRQCLDNLISNAVKFTEEGEIIVAITSGENIRGEHLITVHVSDTGTGIPEHMQEKIFDAFQQMDGTRTRSHGGTGLGLAITRQLATIMGGSLSLKSEVGKGSVFTLCIKTGATESPTLSPNEIKFVEVDRDQPVKLSRKRALIVDDNEINRRVAKSLLSSYNIDCDEAGDGLQALEILDNHDFDVVLLDIHMPVMDGVRTFEKIRQKPGRAGVVPVIALTADAMSGDREKFLGLGMTGYVSKPIDERALVTEIGRVLQTDIAPLDLSA
ncbi:MAG: ATP-binding protein [Pseudomonadota bacterium]